MTKKVPCNLYSLQLADHFVLSNSTTLLTLLYNGRGISEKIDAYLENIYIFNED